MSPRVVLTRLPDGTGALLDLGTMEYFDLNESGCRIWELLEQHPPAEVAAHLAREYALEPAEAEVEVATFLADLRAVGLR